jgi:hypothetical protein
MNPGRGPAPGGWSPSSQIFVGPYADILLRNRHVRFTPESGHPGLLSQLRPIGFLVAMLVDAQLRVDIWLLEAAIGDPCVRALDGPVDQRVGL